jgi:tRNA pseudouridine13 synthase
MRESPYPLEQSLGMSYYATDTPGIGGRLRTTAEDFCVEEVPEDVGTEGPYLICRLKKRDWELQHAVKEIAKRLAISHRRIGWGGTKDRHAVTSQLISLYDVSPEQVASVYLKDISLEVVGRSNAQLSLGALQANRFTIMIRETESEMLAEEVELVTMAAALGLPNYFGLQRFGVTRPITHLVGEHILKGDYEGAVATYAGLPFPGEPDATREARQDYFDTRDPVAALHRFPVRMSFERSMLHHLTAHPGDYPGALKTLPPKLLSMFVSAFQSFLFNCALSSRIRDGNNLHDPVPGDRLLFSSGLEDRVTCTNQQAAAMQLARGRCQIAMFMPGATPFHSTGSDDLAIGALMREHGITSENFREASTFVRTRFDGALRPIALKTEVMTHITGRDVGLRFTLPPGHYATTVCREYMKADPVMMM